jgi:hypothetical protein
LHVSGFTSALDIPRLIVVSCSDSQRLLVEVPNLSLSTVWSLDDHVSVVDEIKISVIFQLGNNIEVSLNKQTEVSIKFTFDWLIWVLISIDDLPLLVDLSMFVVDLNVLVLIIESSSNIHDLSSLVHNELAL